MRIKLGKIYKYSECIKLEFQKVHNSQQSCQQNDDLTFYITKLLIKTNELKNICEKLQSMILPIQKQRAQVKFAKKDYHFSSDSLGVKTITYLSLVEDHHYQRLIESHN